MSSLKRNIPYPKRTIDIHPEKEDRTTVFYDVFICPESDRLLCIGPTLYNLKHHLFPLRIYLNNREIKYKYLQIERLFFLESERLERALSNYATVTFKFRKFSKQVEVCIGNNRKQLYTKSDSEITISTLQKDNPVEWIADWILWHKRLYNVKRVVLYDNGSSNIKQLMGYLPSLEPEVQIIFVHWVYPHGVSPLKSAQHGSLNHCRLKFPVQNGFCINLDIDEYLVKPGSESLSDYLSRTLR